MNKTEYEHFKRQIDFLLAPEVGCLEFLTWNAKQTDRGTVERTEQYPRVVGGWYDNPQSLKRDAGRLHNISGYVSLNPVSRNLMAVSANKLAYIKKGQGTKEDDIVSYKNFLIDIDCRRLKGISATDGELAGTIELRDRILEDYGWFGGSAIWGCSGNGAYIVVKVMENLSKREYKKSISDFLRSLASRYGHPDNNSIFIDTSNTSPTTHVGLAGTFKCKGSCTDDRPFRLITVDGPLPKVSTESHT